jgi:uncharacterized protein
VAPFGVVAASLVLLLGGGTPALASIRAEGPPAFTAPVVDAADVVPDDVERSVSAELLAYQQRSGNQIAVAVVDTTGDAALEDYSIDLARRWGVGTKGKDNGVLLLIAYDDRKMRIEVGRGLEGDLTDLEAGEIIRDQLRPRLQAGDVGGAVEAGTTAIRAALGDTGAVAPVAPAPDEQPDGQGGSAWPLLLFGGLALLSLGGLRRRRRGIFGWGGPMIFGGFGGFGGGGFGRGGFGGGGGFGGFGGGGGGGFGGGGASGSW